jgi:formamidopyrimidine-DNA glycosylase
MPELPEVETVRAELDKILQEHPKITKIRLARGDIRFPIPPELPKRFAGQMITGVRRRAKYLLIDTPKAILLSHLGMTGSWRVLKKSDGNDGNKNIDKHDHCFVELSDGRTLAFRDPRRFGMLDLVTPGHEGEHPRLKDLGVEPLDELRFDTAFLFRTTRKRKVAIKVLLMNQKVVVGVGNIYASEALFRAGVKPTRMSASVTREQCEKIVNGVREVLRAAIAAGGSSIRDYRNLGGEAGGFQDLHLVYDREGEPCPVCRTPIKSKVLAGRSTYWCPHCQK